MNIIFEIHQKMEGKSMVTFVVFEMNPEKSIKVITTLESVNEKNRRLYGADIMFIDPRGVILRRADARSIIDYSSTVKGGKLSSDISELVKVKGPVVFVIGLTLSYKEAAEKDEAESINFESLIAATIVKSLCGKRNSAFLFTSDDTSFCNGFVEAITSAGIIDRERVTYTKPFKSIGDYDDDVMQMRVAELLKYLFPVATK